MNGDAEPPASLLENILAGRLSHRLIAALGVVVTLLVGTPIVVLLLRSPPPASTRASTDRDDTLTQVRENLTKDYDLLTLKTAVQQLNSHSNQFPKERPPGLDPVQRERLQKDLHLTDDELAEIDGGAYTTLDAHHLELCFLLRDVAQALQADVASASANDPAIHLTALDQATAAFNWVVRQVRLETTGTKPIPPEFILRRGQGTALERSLIFIELLRQFNLDNEQATPLTGCLLVEPGTSAADQRLWAVGVVIDKDIYLFEPRLGLPIPGPDGKGVATLAQALNDPNVLGQLTVEAKSPADQKFPYDVNSEQARNSDAYLYVSLSALAPRLAHLQRKVLTPDIHVNLAVDLGAEETRLQAALEAAGAKTTAVRAHPDGIRLLRAFLPAEEDGADTKPFPMSLRVLPGFADPNDSTVVQMWRQRFFEYELVPWWGLPDPFRQIPFNSGLGSFVREQYSQPFRQSALEPKNVRDLILHGHYVEAINRLVEERDQLTNDFHQLKRAIHAANNERAFDDRVYKWLVQDALPAAADMERKKQASTEEYLAAANNMMKVWHSSGDAIVLLKGKMAAKRRPEVTYLLALAKQERAEQLQLRLDATARANTAGPSKEDTARAVVAWKSAEEWWRRYADEYPTGPAAAALRRPRGRCQLMLGDWQAAVATWENLADPPASATEQYPPLAATEKAGNLYLAKRLREQHQPGGKP
jgi:hypothetical protein